ncbi:MAG: PIN domain-containing protein [Acidobacteriota bacterium]|nr:PIN domain-containing protein [Acidobacteriota bacterium]
MIVVDTSVWVSVLRSPTAPEAPLLAQLIDADVAILPLPVRLELLSGARARDRAALQRRLSALAVARPTEETWALMEHWLEAATDKGRRFGVGDLLIAALAAERGALVWSLDTDFERMAELKLVQLYR